MDQVRVSSRLGLAALVAAVALGAAACGAGSKTTTPSNGGPPQQAAFTDDRPGLVEPEPAIDSANHVPRGASVTYNDPPPPIAAAVKAAAEAAKCTVASFASETEPSMHTEAEAAATQSIPPLSGAHNARWADWGVYNKPVPFKHQLHNLEHGGVFVHYGKDVPVAGVNAIREWWAKSPAYLIVAPDTAPKFPTDAVVVGSQQRWLVCKPFKPEQVSAIDAFVNEYRGRGPEQIPAKDAGGDRPSGLPAPKISDKGAK